MCKHLLTGLTYQGVKDYQGQSSEDDISILIKLGTNNYTFFFLHYNIEGMFYGPNLTEDNNEQTAVNLMPHMGKNTLLPSSHLLIRICVTSGDIRSHLVAYLC